MEKGKEGGGGQTAAVWEEEKATWVVEFSTWVAETSAWEEKCSPCLAASKANTERQKGER